ncbi:ATP-binding protein, partial [Chloroflexota bacterium]
EDANSEYIESNLVDETFITLRLNLMLFIHSSGRIVFGKAFDLDNEEEIPSPPSLLEHLSGNSLLVGHSGTESITSGIILLDEGPMLVVPQPILTSEDKGPARGTLIFGRYLNSAELDRLAQVTLSKLTMHPIDGVMPHDFQEALPSLLGEAPISIQLLSTQHVAGYTLIKDIYGKPVLMLRVHIPRDIYQLGQGAVIYYISVVLGIGLLAAGVVMLIIQKQVLARFTTLIRSINRIATSGDVSTRISMKGRDELTLVANTINGMLGALQESDTELKELYQNEKDLRRGLEEETQKRLEYTRALVHELKTPLTPVLAATELLLEEIKEERLMRLVQSIDRSASNLNRRVDELLDLARGELDMLELNPESVDPVSLLQEISDEMTPVALGNEQSLTFELPSSIPVVSADRERLRQVVQNLLNNALKFTPAGGKITLRAREDGANLVVEVQDTGLGISKKDQEQLFDPYYRVESDGERLSGLGLGLALSKSLVKLHGGRIWVKSKQGAGSTFSFSIPLESDSQTKGVAEPRGKS